MREIPYRYAHVPSTEYCSVTPNNTPLYYKRQDKLLGGNVEYQRKKLWGMNRVANCVNISMNLPLSPALRNGGWELPSQKVAVGKSKTLPIHAFRQNPSVISIGRAGRVQLRRQPRQLADFALLIWARNYMEFYIGAPVRKSKRPTLYVDLTTNASVYSRQVS